MTQIFIAANSVDSICRMHLRRGLEAQHYTIAKLAGNSHQQSALYCSMVENALLGSAAMVLIWSHSTGEDAKIAQQWQFMLQLSRPIFLIVLDQTLLPGDLLALPSIQGQLPYSNAVTKLLAIADFPPAQNQNPFFLMCEKASHSFISQRKESIDHAALLLKDGIQQQAIVALLNYLAQNDSIASIREKALEVLKATTQLNTPSIPGTNSIDAQHCLRIRCKKGHISEFDKRVVCTQYRMIYRGSPQNMRQAIDELVLKCTTCGEDIVAYVDCGDYR